MITIMPESTDQMLALQATGTLTQADYQDVCLPALQKIIDEYEVANAVFYMDADFKGWEMAAMWEDTKFGIKHRNHFARIAIVGGPDWIHWGVKLGELMMDSKIKTYSPNQLQEALKWAAVTAKCTACDSCDD